MNCRKLLFYLLTNILIGISSFSLAEERVLTPEQMEAIAKQGEIGETDEKRSGKYPDLTKGELYTNENAATRTFGPTGIAGVIVGKDWVGDQIQVQASFKGSPSEGKFFPGDVIIGVNGRKFRHDEHLGYSLGKAIIEAEREQNAGLIKFLVWRDKNFNKRNGEKNVSAVDIDSLFAKARDDNSLYEWKSEEEKKREVQGFEEFPIEAVNLEIVLKLRTFPEYSDTAPYDCPKTRQILEEAWKVLEQKFIKDPKRPKSGGGGFMEALALVASGKPEHRELVKKWVRSKAARKWHPPEEAAGEMFKPDYKGYKGYQSWHHGYTGLNCALYYEATGDTFVLPALRKYAINAAMGQSGGGSWGHTFAFPSFNGGELHKMNPHYGAVNAAGNRCFFLIVLAKKLGIEHPEIDAAIRRAHRFFGSYVDQGCIPYGDHPAYASDDSNGKNSGIAFAMKLLGDDYGAKYFASMSSHCAFTRRGGHGHDYHGNWSSWAASLCGKEVRIMNERNLRWRRTLCRMFDGRFVYQCATGKKYGALRDPTATEVLHQAVSLKQTLITGKDANEKLFLEESEIEQLLASARPQLNDPILIEKAGKPWRERSTDEVFKLLNIFYPKARERIANELGKRYLAGEKEIANRFLSLLESDDARIREGSCMGLAACGSDVFLGALSKITNLLDDPKEFVRVAAVELISKHSVTDEVQLEILHSTVAEPRVASPNSFRNASQLALFANDSRFANKPFEAGFDTDLVRKAIEDVLTLDPVGGRGFVTSRVNVWDKKTVLEVAGPLTFAAEEEQIVEQMFANRCTPAQQMLNAHGYCEGLFATAHRLRKQAAISRSIRSYVGFKRNLMDPSAVRKNPAVFRGFIGELGRVLIDDPLKTVEEVVGQKKIKHSLIGLYDLIAATDRDIVLKSILPDVQKLFHSKMENLDGVGAKLKLCRAELSDVNRKNYFRKIAAMDYLVEILDDEALRDLMPFISHTYWRLRDHSRALVVGIMNAGGVPKLLEIYKQSKDPLEAAAILDLFGQVRAKEQEALVKNALNHSASPVREAAVKALSAIGGDAVLAEILEFLAGAESKRQMIAAEQALLSQKDDQKYIEQMRNGVISMLATASESLKSSLYYILAQIGDKESLATLEAAAGTDDIASLEAVIYALSYSPRRKADQLMLKLAKVDEHAAKVVGNHSVRRLVIGPKGFGDISNSQRLDFAEPMLKLNRNKKLIIFLRNVREARALRALMYCLERGSQGAAESLIANAEQMRNLKPVDAKIAAKAIQDVIEYIEVTKLRGGPTARMKKEDRYYYWKALQARAGKALLHVHAPEEDPIDGFDELNLDL